MELIMKDLSVRSLKDYQRLNRVDYTFKSGQMTFCYGISGALFRDLLFNKKKPLNGYLVVSEVGKISDIAYLGNDVDKEFYKYTVKEELEYINLVYEINRDDVIEISNSLMKALGLNNIMAKEINSLSAIEKKKFRMVCSLLSNPKIIILDFFFNGFIYKERENILKILRKLKNNYNKNIIIFDDKNDNYLSYIDEYVIFDKGKIVYTGNKHYDDELYKYIDEPQIIRFTKMVQSCAKNGKEIENYIDVKELIKAIYRDIGY